MDLQDASMRKTDPTLRSAIRQLALIALVALLVACAKAPPPPPPPPPPPDASQVAADARRLIEGTVTVYDIPVDPSLHQTEIASVSPPLQVQEAPPTYEFCVEAYAVLTDPKQLRPQQGMRSLQDVFALQQWVRSGGPLLKPGAAVPYEVVLLYQQGEGGNRLVRHEVRASQRLTQRPLPSVAAAPAVANRPGSSQSSAVADQRPIPAPTTAPTARQDVEAPVTVPDRPSPVVSTTPTQEAKPADVSLRGPSFDCGDATTPVETAICADGTLSTLDAEMGDAYASARRRADTAGRYQLRNEQRQWIRDRNRRCGEPVDVACLRNALASRRDALQRSQSTNTTLLKVQPLHGRIPTVSRREPVASLCQDELLAPQSVEEQLAADAGWLQLAPLQRADRFSRITAVSALDGSCRPQGEILMVFDGGRAVASIEPSDAGKQRIRTITEVPGDRLRITLDLWAVDDPRCCPTGEATVEIELRPFAESEP
jgi:uncharacterized protein